MAACQYGLMIVGKILQFGASFGSILSSCLKIGNVRPSIVSSLSDERTARSSSLPSTNINPRHLPKKLKEE